MGEQGAGARGAREFKGDGERGQGRLRNEEGQKD